MPDLLIELFSEEIPARMQAKAAEDLKKRVADGLVEAGLTYASAASFATPRRLTLALDGLTARSNDIREERKGPRTDAPAKALDGFLRSTGLTRDQLETRDDKKGQVFFAVIEKPGRAASDIVAEVLDGVIRDFPWPKSMRWGSGGLRWVRPLQSILCILSEDAETSIVPLTIDGLTSGDTTEGHRFMAPGRFRVLDFEDYEAKLKRAFVLLRPEMRADQIWNEASQLAFAQGLELVEDKGLLAELAGLVEWPVVLMGEIGKDFLDLPPEVLQTSMREHQKFFSVRNPKSGLIERYITVANRETADNGATILHGNGKVLAARLSDAKFFWENDLREVDAGMVDWLAKLGAVTFHRKLGSVADRVTRIGDLACVLSDTTSADPELAVEAARFSKADLASEMVYEFPELQGTMGRYYATHRGLKPEVAEAIESHYAPLGPSDTVPTAPVAATVALAEKLDTLAGFWAIDEKPTGSKDPFALRRAALGVIRILLENDLKLNLVPVLERQILANELAADPDMSDDRMAALLDLVREVGLCGVFVSAWEAIAARESNGSELSADHWLVRIRENVPATAVDLLGFLADRLKVYLRNDGIRHDAIDAVFRLGGQDDIVSLVARVRALQAVLDTADGENLVQGYKRTVNILTQEEAKDGIEYSLPADPKFAETDEERALFTALEGAASDIDAALKREDFPSAMAGMAKLRGPIDAFFETAMINAENQIVRRNRLCLLNRIREVMDSVAILSSIEG